MTSSAIEAGSSSVRDATWLGAIVRVRGEGLGARARVRVGGAGGHPALDVVAPLAALRDVKDARPRDGGGRGVGEISDLEDQTHVRQQPDALVGGEGEQPVVVHDAVHVLDPVGVEVAVEDDPLGVGVGRVGEVAHDTGE